MNIMDEVQSISRETFQAKQKSDAEERVVKQGRWEGIVYTYNLVEETPQTPEELRGKRVYNVGLKLFDCPEYGQSKLAFVKMTPDELLNAKGKPVAKYGSAIDLVGVVDMFDQPFVDVLEQAKVTRAKYNIQVWYKDEERTTPGGNWVRGVSKIG